MVPDMTDYPLRHIEIDGFRGFDNFVLPGLGGVNVLVGGNNSGKTSLLEAILVLCSPTEPEKLLEMIRFRDPGAIDESRLHSLRWCFRRNTALEDPGVLISAECEMRVRASFGLEKLHITLDELVGEPSADELERFKRLGRRIDSEKVDQEWRGSNITYQPSFVPHEHDLFPAEGANSVFSMLIWDGLPITRLRNKQRKDLPRIECAVVYPYSYQMNQIQVQSLSRVQSGDEGAVVTDLLRQFDKDVLDVDIGSSRGYRPAIYLRHRSLGLAPLSVFGDAMRRSVLLASMLTSLPHGGVLLIDEAEAGIHVEAQQQFFAWLMTTARQRGVQVFMTTHSLEALDAMLLGQSDPADEDGLVVFQLNREDSGIQCKRFAGDLLHRLRFERGLDVR